MTQPEKTATPKDLNAFSKQLGLDAKQVGEIIKISGKPSVNILSDPPANEDTFGVDALVRILSNVILSEETQTPITIGIDGKWGTGKTSILQMIEAQARMLEFHCIWLNAWSLENTQHLIAAVTGEIQREIDIKISGKRKEALKRQLSKWWAQRLLGDLVDSTVQTLQEHEQDLSEVASAVISRRSFEELIQGLLQSSKYEPSRLIVFIDDIDRALPDQIAAILKNLKLILEVPNCVFVLAMDMDIVARAIENYYTQSDHEPVGEEGFGYSYLEKLIQIRVEVPALTRESAYAALRKMGLDPEVFEIIHWAPDEDVLNPRCLKQYVNWLSISLQLIRSLLLPSGVRNITALRAMALRRSCPEIYNRLLTDDIQFEEVGEFLKTSKPIGNIEDDLVGIISSKFRSSLNNDQKHVDLPEEFRKRRITLSSSATALVLELGNRWLIVNGGMNYYIEAREEGLHVYKDNTIMESLSYLRKLPKYELSQFDAFVGQNPMLNTELRRNHENQRTNQGNYSGCVSVARGMNGWPRSAFSMAKTTL